MIEIVQYRSKCIGCNACVEASATRWRMSRKDGKCTLVGGKNNKGIYIAVINDDEYEQALQAAKNCPVNIIKVKRK